MLRVGGIIFALLLAATVTTCSVLKSVDAILLDTQFGFLRAFAPRPAPMEVVVVGFDEKSTDVLRQPMSLWHPHLGRFLQAAASAGASVVGLDVVLPDRSFDAFVPGYDRELLTGILLARRRTPVILALTVAPDGRTRPIHPAFVSAAGSDAVGYALLHLDPDGVVRRFDEHIELNGAPVPSLAGEMARRLGKTVGPGLIDFGEGPAFPFIALQDVLAWWEAGDSVQLMRHFAGKAVMLGSVLKFEDRHRAPVNLVGWDDQAMHQPGVLLHAQVLRNLLNGGLVQPAAEWLGLLFALAASLLCLLTLSPVAAGLLVLATALVALGGSTLGLYHGVYWPPLTVVATAVFSVGARQAMDIGLGLRERVRLRRAFGGYVSPPVMQDILQGKLTPTLGGEERFACVLFSDIRGYTRRSELNSPEQTIRFLNAHFERVVPLIHAHGGTVVSFMGDGIMAAFGVPNTLPNPCAAAYGAAVAMLADRRSQNDALIAGGGSPIHIGIGMHAGIGLAGHVGASSRHEYSVIGDVSNVASRLEDTTKEVGFRLVCSRAVMEQLPRDSALVALGVHAIKGHSPVEIYGFEAIAEFHSALACQSA